MVRDEKETVQEKVLYSRKEGEGLSFEKLDEKMQSWGRKKFGDRYARDLWRDELLELKSLKLGEDNCTTSRSTYTAQKFMICLAKKIVGRRMVYSTQIGFGPWNGKTNAGNGRERSSSVTWKRFAPVRQHGRCKSKG
jgi:hypothetical protein